MVKLNLCAACLDRAKDAFTVIEGRRKTGTCSWCGHRCYGQECTVEAKKEARHD